ncbi:hypothetical protein DFH05DRAFT_1531073 [Lentinula detonsa]|uniref:Uncharacterized protein n=1 Tax=Lentinula detonsa TaxID=2804962 RepID=A0A9W8NQ82_9AGAR|nr:hypothetical protein DFH05DRAFT_1531073 [Lentinula detonsa]
MTGRNLGTSHTPSPPSNSYAMDSKSVISDESDDVVVDEEPEGTPRGTTNFPDPDGEFDAEEDDEDNAEPPSPSRPRPACMQCVLLETHASCRSRGKWTKIEEDEVYKGPASRVAARTFGGSEVLEQFAGIERRLSELEWYASRSTMALERIAGILVRKEKRELGAMEGNEEGEEEEEEEDKDGEGEDEDNDEENERQRKDEVREGKKCAE